MLYQNHWQPHDHPLSSSTTRPCGVGFELHWDDIRHGVADAVAGVRHGVVVVGVTPFTIAIVGPRSADTAVMLYSSAGALSWRYLQQQQQRFERQSHGGLQDIG